MMPTNTDLDVVVLSARLAETAALGLGRGRAWQVRIPARCSTLAFASQVHNLALVHVVHVVHGDRGAAEPHKRFADVPVRA